MERLQNLSAINTNTIEGRLLIAAMAKISEGIHTNKQPDEVLEICHDLAELIYKDAGDLPVFPSPATFEEALSTVINQWSKENESDTPDFILAAYISASLTAYADTVKLRDKWYGITPWTMKNFVRQEAAKDHGCENISGEIKESLGLKIEPPGLGYILENPDLG